MKGYVINLDRSVERLTLFRERAARVGLNFERFPAIDGKQLSDDVVDFWQQRSRIWGPLLPTEVACFLSHRGVWQKIASGSDPWAMVVEDDVVFSPDAGEVLSSSDWFPQGSHVVKFETMGNRVELSARVYARKDGYKLRRLKDDHIGAAGYILDRESAQFLVEWTRDRCEPADKLLFHPSQLSSAGYPILQMTPALCMQDFHLLTKQELQVATSSIGPILNRRQGQPPRDRRMGSRLVRALRRILRDVGRIGLRLSGISVFEKIRVPSYPPQR
ncbi:glycosyltransferase family 25 protein [Pleomorphomonas sp. NRK KF1]|uniref:glycosyltransferase family 25 protein n=1 Tax=Pleomorphomonas sp. NRK KF1 TaxID=2943000 RepID=UPI002044C4D0|nr:glycosyltransferase family 25 protein [Pleomorphomonas sp. NRK KF1]MCM5555138.1 glycosyltransferase family 25 protein [Pleomorphomonas sp. NRK KF1]